MNPHHLVDLHPALNEAGSQEERAKEREARLRAIDGLGDEQGNGEVGIFKISHLGQSHALRTRGSRKDVETDMICFGTVIQAGIDTLGS